MARVPAQIDRENPKDQSLHLICDIYATHKHPKVKEWLEKHPRFTVHFTPTSASWLNMVERFFRDITTGRLRRGVFRRVPELNAAIKEYIAMQPIPPSLLSGLCQGQQYSAKSCPSQSSLKLQTE